MQAKEKGAAAKGAKRATRASAAGTFFGSAVSIAGSFVALGEEEERSIAVLGQEDVEAPRDARLPGRSWACCGKSLRLTSSASAFVASSWRSTSVAVWASTWRSANPRAHVFLATPCIGPDWFGG